MTKFVDGPAAGALVFLRRAPLFLRAVKGSVGDWDALDQVDDKPHADETIVAYRRRGDVFTAHVQRVVDGRRCGGWYQGGEYFVVSTQPPDAVMRDNAEWRKWAESEGRF